jgi:hypothetical protein
MKNINSNKGNLYLILIVNGLYLAIALIAYLIKMSTYPISANLVDFLSLIPYLVIGIIISVGLSFYFYKKYERQNISIMDKSKVFLLVNLPSFILFDLTIFIILSMVIQVD